MKARKKKNSLGMWTALIAHLDYELKVILHRIVTEVLTERKKKA